MAKETAILTHSNKNGYNGAILQALAVFKALNAETDIKYADYLRELQEEMAKLENCDVPDSCSKFEEFERYMLVLFFIYFVLYFVILIPYFFRTKTFDLSNYFFLLAT